MSAWSDRFDGLLPATMARYALMCPISNEDNTGKIFYFRTMQGLKAAMGDAEQQKAMLPFRIVHAKELVGNLSPAAGEKLKKEPCYDSAPELVAEELAELRGTNVPDNEAVHGPSDGEGGHDEVHRPPDLGEGRQRPEDSCRD